MIEEIKRRLNSIKSMPKTTTKTESNRFPREHLAGITTCPDSEIDLVQVKCSNCGGTIDLDDSNITGICKFCGSKFIKEDKIINNYTINIMGNKNNVVIGTTQENSKKISNTSTYIDSDKKNKVPQSDQKFDTTNFTVQSFEENELVLSNSVDKKTTQTRKILRIFSWLVCFPLPVTTFLLKVKDLAVIAKIVIIIVAWAAYVPVFMATVPSRIPVISTLSKAEIDSSGNYIIDYGDAESFEYDLNAGLNLKGKVVRFNVGEYKPYSALGKNLWAGEHLNFIVSKKPNVTSGDTTTVIANRIFKYFDSWVINCEVIDNSDYSEDTKFNKTVNN